MPIYDYRCKECELKMNVLRDLKEYDVPPTEEEIAKVEANSECDHDLERYMPTTPTVQKGRNWGSKGYW